MPRCVVTGVTGFLGRALVAELRASGWFVRGIARHAADTGAHEQVIADLATLPTETTAFLETDVVFHLAAKTHDVTEARGVEREYERTNVEGTRRVVDAARRAAVRRVVFASSVKVIDEGNRHPASEDTPVTPTTPYGRSKLEAERLIRGAGGAGAFEAACLRFPLIYGPGQQGNLQRLISAIERGRFPPPPRNGNARSMLHVGNAVHALLLAATQPLVSERVYLVTDNQPYSTREIYDAVTTALGREPSSFSVPEWVFRCLAWGGDLARALVGRRVGFDSDAFQKLLGSASYDSQRIRTELGYQPRYDLKGSLRSLIEEARTPS